MADIKGKFETMLREAEAKEQLEAKKREQGKSVFSRLMSDSTGYLAFLRSLAEHPEKSISNVATIADMRVKAGYKDCQELHTEEEMKELGGSFRRGFNQWGSGIRQRTYVSDKAIAEMSDDDRKRLRVNGNFATVWVYPAEVMVGLDPDRYKGIPERVKPEDKESILRFQAATAEAGLEELSPAATYVVNLRYGIGDAVPPMMPKYVDVEWAKQWCTDIRNEVNRVCSHIDRELDYQRHPERRERDEQRRAERTQARQMREQTLPADKKQPESFADLDVHAAAAVATALAGGAAMAAASPFRQQAAPAVVNAVMD